MEFSYKERYNIDDLTDIVKLLRSPDGCPWDKVQTHKSICNDLIEECYEVIEAIDTDDTVLLREELGDVLLQVVFHADIESDSGHFNFDDVASDICKKLIHRHPHVFGNVVANTPEEVLKNWDAIKKTEKNQETTADTLNAVSRSLPALMRGAKLIKRAYRAGMSHERDAVIGQVREYLDKLSQIPADSAETEPILGEILLNICELSFQSQLFPEQLLTDASERFIMDSGKNIPPA
jgi:tetrapyrrole methylase family protein/MazG family protein